MRYKFLSNLILVLLLNLLIKPFWIFGIDRKVQEEVGAEVYGSYFALFSFSFLFNILLDVGITYYNNKSIAEDREKLKQYFSGIISVKVLLGIIYVLVSLVVANVIGYSSEQLWLIVVLLFNQFLVSMIYYVRSNISGLHHFTADSIISTLDRLLLIVFCGLVLWTNTTGLSMNIELFVYAQTGAYLTTFVVALVFLLTKSGKLNLSFNAELSLEILRKSIPYAVLVLLMTLYTRMDAVMIERLLPDGKTQAGIYAQGYRFLDALNMVAFLFAGLLLPIFSKMLSDNDDVRPMTILAAKLLVFPAMVVVFLCSLFAHDIIEMVYSSNIEDASKVFEILIITFLPIASNYIFGTLLTANGSLKQLNLISSGSLVLNLVLNFMLIPKYGAYGAAIATVGTQSLAAFLQFFAAKNMFSISLNVTVIFKLMGLILIMGVLCYLKGLLELDWLILFTLFGAILLVYGMFTRLIHLQDLYKILKEKV